MAALPGLTWPRRLRGRCWLGRIDGPGAFFVLEALTCVAVVSRVSSRPLPGDFTRRAPFRPLVSWPPVPWPLCFLAGCLHHPTAWPATAWPAFAWPVNAWPVTVWSAIAWPVTVWSAIAWPVTLWSAIVWPTTVLVGDCLADDCFGPAERAFAAEVLAPARRRRSDRRAPTVSRRRRARCAGAFFAPATLDGVPSWASQWPSLLLFEGRLA